MIYKQYIKRNLDKDFYFTFATNVINFYFVNVQ